MADSPRRPSHRGADPDADAAQPAHKRLAQALAAYARRWPEEAETVALFEALLGEGATSFTRARTDGHFTASAWLVSADGQRILLTHHRKLGLWLQLGGHADGEEDLAQAALQEAREESGLDGLVVEPLLFDLDRHWIPEHGPVAAHWHYDARFIVRATGGEEFTVSDESLALAWRDIAELVHDEAADASLRRMAGKWLSR